MATNKRSAGWREATGDFFYKCYFDISQIQTELRISEPLPTKEHDEAVLRGTICGKYKRNDIFQLPPPSAENAFCQARSSFWKWSRSQEKRQSRFWKQSFISVFWTLRRCFCFHRPDPFSAKLVFIIPGWAQTGRRCQRLTQNVDFKFLHIILSAIMKS